MRSVRILLLFLLVGIGLASCVMTNQIRTIQIEILKPALFNVDKHNAVAIINRNLFQSDTCNFYYSNGHLKVQNFDMSSQDRPDTINVSTIRKLDLYETKSDTSIKYHNLTDTCITALVNYLDSENYFQKVIVVGDSLNQLLKMPESLVTKQELFEKTESDVCVFLDYLHLETIFNKYYSIPFKTKAMLIWTVAFKHDSLAYTYNQIDTLLYDQEQLIAYNRFKEKILSKLINNSCIFLGQSFGTKIIPSWMPSERLYYKSNNPEMKNAQKFAIQQNWLKAAEIWNRQSKNKNDKIAAKACYNMALACEMEGKPDVAIAWLVKSFSGLKRNDELHKPICQRYVNILAVRKLEIEQLKDQVSIQDLSNKTEY